MRPTAPCNGSSHKPMRPAPPSGKSSICGVRSRNSPHGSMRRRRQLPQIRWSWPSDNINWLRSTSAAGRRTSTPYRPNGDGSACCRPVPERALTASTLGAAANSARERNAGFLTAEGEKIPEHNTAVCACIAQTQTVRSGEMVRLRLLEEAAVDGVRLPRGTSLYGEASLDGVRLRIVVRSIRYQGRIFPLEAAAYDLDGQPGLNIPDSRERRAVKEALADIGQQTGTSIDISRNAGQQVLADISRTALRATTRYAAEKLKEVKITLKADHRIYLLSKE